MSGFLERISLESLKRLRKIVALEQYNMGYPKEFIFSDENKRQIDMIIDEYGIKTAEDLIRRGMGSGLIERKTSVR